MVLGHGFGGSARNFRPQARALSTAFRVVLYDARGHARSEAPSDPAQYQSGCFVEDLLRVVEQSAERRVVVGGLSMGAAVALRFALAHPSRVRGVVLAAFPPPSQTRSGGNWAEAFADAIDQRGVDAAGAEFVWGARSRFDPEGAKLIRQGFLEHPGHALSSTLRHLLSAQPDAAALEPKLTALEVPVLLVAGGNDAPSVAISRELARALPDSKLVIIDGAGHVVNLAAPDAFNSALQTFLHRVCSSGS